MPSLSEYVRDLLGALIAAIDLEKEFKEDDEFINGIKKVLKIAKIGLTDATGNALHRLHESQPSIDAVKKLIQGIPDALSFKNEEGQLPIQSAVWDLNTVKYVPILAQVGTKHNVGGRGMRGGLMVTDPEADDGKNTLQLLAHLGYESDPITCDTDHFDAMNELRKDNLLLKEDINIHDLLIMACHPTNKMRFKYLAERDPDNLMTGIYNDLPLSHAIIEHSKDLTRFNMFLTTSLKHHPQHLGLLFQKGKSGKTAYEIAIEKHGKDETFKVIKQCIPADTTTIPILHHVIKDAPKHMNDFTIRYPSATYLRDEDGRSFVQAELAVGTKIFANDGLFFTRMKDGEIAEIDPVTNQYPFLTCASREISDLSTIFVLLSKNPSLLEKYIEQTTDEFAEEARSRNRNRDGGSDVKNEMLQKPDLKS